MFGSGVVGRGVKSCLQAGGGRVVTEEVGNGIIIGWHNCYNVAILQVWMAWASREPPELVWLTTSYRQQASLKVQHGVKCSSCQASPMIGMRYVVKTLRDVKYLSAYFLDTSASSVFLTTCARLVSLLARALKATNPSILCRSIATLLLRKRRPRHSLLPSLTNSRRDKTNPKLEKR